MTFDEILLGLLGTGGSWVVELRLPEGREGKISIKNGKLCGAKLVHRDHEISGHEALKEILSEAESVEEVGLYPPQKVVCPEQDLSLDPIDLADVLSSLKESGEGPRPEYKKVFEYFMKHLTKIAGLLGAKVVKADTLETIIDVKLDRDICFFTPEQMVSILRELNKVFSSSPIGQLVFMAIDTKDLKFVIMSVLRKYCIVACFEKNGKPFLLKTLLKEAEEVFKESLSTERVSES